ncbi:queuosine precursor transporter [Methanobrevibacter sp. DSM 116169]|uniref:queuosine precursor transporter n=1 Tax=Methanobrevibacter sp. DSM 116169 TaxID=3242727 RepID=UPI0038FCA490
MFKTNIEISKVESYTILTGIFCVCLIISNLLAFKTFSLAAITLPVSVIIYPIIFVVSDILAEIYGFEKTKKVIFLGFLLNLLAVILFQIAIWLPPSQYFTGAEAFNVVFSNSLRVLVASFSGYLIGSLINAYIMVYLKEKAEKYLFFRCSVSTFFGEIADSSLFITIAFIGSMPIYALITMIVVQTLFKTAYEVVIYPVTRKIIKVIEY